MPFARYTFTYRCTGRGHLPPYKGSTLRGVLGRNLRYVVCGLARQSCSQCHRAPRCLYALMFEHPAAVPRPARLAAPPRPYVLEPPAEDHTDFAPGDRFSFRLLLFGEVNRQLPYLVFALILAGERGMGSFRPERAVRFRLEGVSVEGHDIYDPHAERLIPGDWSRPLRLPPSPPARGELTLQMLTPLRLKWDGRLLQTALPFPLLVRGLLRRVSGLWTAYAGGEPELDYRGLVARAQAVEVTHSRLRWHDLQRYSRRQGTRMALGGLVGSVTYRGPIGEYLGLLELARQVHLGKQTTFGLGQIDFQWQEE